MAKKNPQDATLRNIRATRKQVTDLDRYVRELYAYCRRMSTRLNAIERKLKL